MTRTPSTLVITSTRRVTPGGGTRRVQLLRGRGSRPFPCGAPRRGGTEQCHTSCLPVPGPARQARLDGTIPQRRILRYIVAREIPSRAPCAGRWSCGRSAHAKWRHVPAPRWWSGPCARTPGIPAGGRPSGLSGRKAAAPRRGSPTRTAGRFPARGIAVAGSALPERSCSHRSAGTCAGSTAQGTRDPHGDGAGAAPQGCTRLMRSLAANSASTVCSAAPRSAGRSNRRATSASVPPRPGRGAALDDAEVAHLLAGPDPSVT